MYAVNDPKAITVRYAAGTYIARCYGKTASRTACAKDAAEAVAEKLFGNKPHAVVRMDGDRLWKIVEHGND